MSEPAWLAEFGRLRDEGVVSETAYQEARKAALHSAQAQSSAVADSPATKAQKRERSPAPSREEEVDDAPPKKAGRTGASPTAASSAAATGSPRVPSVSTTATSARDCPRTFETLDAKGLKLAELCPSCGHRVSDHEERADRTLRLQAQGAQSGLRSIAEYNAVVGAGSWRPGTMAAGELLTGALLDREDTKHALLQGVEKVVGMLGKVGEKTDYPLIATVGISGSGKTTVCKLLHGNEPSHNWGEEVRMKIHEVRAKIQAGGGRADDLADALAQPALPLVVLMVTFGQNIGYDPDVEKPMPALLCRAYADFVGAAHGSAHAAMLPPELADLKPFLQTVRRLEAAKPKYNGCFQPEDVSVMLLVDEVMCIKDSIARSALVTALALQEQTEVMFGRVFIPFVTSLEMETFLQLRKSSQRTIHGIPLPPLASDATTTAVLQTLYAKADVAAVFSPSAIDFGTRARIDTAVAAAGGHPRSLERLLAWDFKKADYTFPIRDDSRGEGLAVLECHLDSLVDRFVGETQLMGPITPAGLMNRSYITLDRADYDTLQFVPRPLPWALRAGTISMRKNYCWGGVADLMKAPLFAESAVLDRCYYDLRMQSGLWRQVERAIPQMLELKARAWLRYGRGDSENPATDFALEAVVPDVVIKLHPHHRRVVVRPDVLISNYVQVDKLADAKVTLAECCCVVSNFNNEKALELFTHMCAAETNELARPRVNVRFSWQMKLWETLTPGKVKKVAKAGAAAMEALDFNLKDDYFVLCTSAPTTTRAKNRLPNGSILLGPEACQKLLQPYGLPPPLAVVMYKGKLGDQRVTEEHTECGARGGKLRSSNEPNVH